MSFLKNIFFILMLALTANTYGNGGDPDDNTNGSGGDPEDASTIERTDL